MQLTATKYRADRRRIKAFVASRIPEEGSEVVLAEGKVVLGKVGRANLPSSKLPTDKVWPVQWQVRQQCKPYWRRTESGGKNGKKLPLNSSKPPATINSSRSCSSFPGHSTNGKSGV